MMNSTYDASGRYLSVQVKTVVPEGMEPPPSMWGAEVHGTYEGVVDLFTDYHDSVTDQPVSMGVKPTPFHVFNYTTKQWDDPRTAATEWVVVRARRDFLLSDTDWVVTKAMEAGTPVPADWKTYRQALRDITVQADPFKLVWPTPPS